MPTVWQRLRRTLLRPLLRSPTRRNGSEPQTCGIDPWALEVTLPRVWFDAAHRHEDGEWVGATMCAPASERELFHGLLDEWLDALRYAQERDRALPVGELIAENHLVFCLCDCEEGAT